MRSGRPDHRRRLLAGAAAIALVRPASILAAPAKPQLHAALRRIADDSGGRMGVSALALARGERIQLDGSARYPMASTFKVAVAMTVLDRVDRRALSLSERLTVAAGDLSPGSGEINQSMVDAGSNAVRSTVGELLDAMMVVSDNTATDHLLARIGGPPAVRTRLRALGLDGIDVSRPAAQIVADAWGFVLPPAGARDRSSLVRRMRETPVPVREQAATRFLNDPRDTTTPDEMAALLVALFEGKALTDASTTLLLDVMARCRTGPKRIKGQLPSAVRVAHKTGTLRHVCTNDVGIVALPHGGPLIVALYISGSPLPLAQQEQAIAAAAYELFRYCDR